MVDIQNAIKQYGEDNIEGVSDLSDRPRSLQNAAAEIGLELDHSH